MKREKIEKKRASLSQNQSEKGNPHAGDGRRELETKRRNTCLRDQTGGGINTAILQSKGSAGPSRGGNPEYPSAGQLPQRKSWVEEDFRHLENGQGSTTPSSRTPKNIDKE